jgi:5-methylthioribose kinase
MYLDERDIDAIGQYLLARGLADSRELPCVIERAGDGNMNLTVRVKLGNRSLILKQGRPWVEKYRDIAAPPERTLVEARFYRAARAVGPVSARMPALLDVDADNRVLVLEDLGAVGDYSSLYVDAAIPDTDVDHLLRWLSALRLVTPRAADEDWLRNREMHALNHEHIFRLPLAEQNGLDLDRISHGLSASAAQLKREADYCRQVQALGARYLDDGRWLVHGDYFPGSWVRTHAGIRIIDPEFCFLGVREFDYGVMLAHFALARLARRSAERVLVASREEGLDESLTLGFAGTEIMRRLMGVAQLRLPYGIETKRQLLDLSRSFVLAPSQGLSCWHTAVGSPSPS